MAIIEVDKLFPYTSERVHVSLYGLLGDRDPQQSLDRIEPIIKNSLSKPDFTGERIAYLEEWLENDPEGEKNALLIAFLDYSLLVHQVSEQNGILTETGFGVSGHDMENVVHTVTSILEMIDETDGELGNYATWELIVSGLNENIGRLMEGNDYTHQVTGFLLGRNAIRIFEKEGKTLRLKGEELHMIASRVLGNIYDHGGKNTGDPLSDLIRQSNRLQMCEPRFLRRSLEYDVAQIGQDIISPEDTKRTTDISITFKPGATSMDWGEFYVRNLFPFEDRLNESNPEVFKRIMHKNQMTANDRRANSVALLTILAGGENTELFRQIFAPELGLVKETHWSKRILPDRVFQEGKRKFHNFVENPPKFPSLEGIDDKRQIALILKEMSSYLTEDMLEKIYQKYERLSKDQQKRIGLALRHSLNLHKKELDNEYTLLERHVRDENLSVAKVAKFAKKYLDSKDRLD